MESWDFGPGSFCRLLPGNDRIIGALAAGSAELHRVERDRTLDVATGNSREATRFLENKFEWRTANVEGLDHRRTAAAMAHENPCGAGRSNQRIGAAKGHHLVQCSA